VHSHVERSYLCAAPPLQCLGSNFFCLSEQHTYLHSNGDHNAITYSTPWTIVAPFSHIKVPALLFVHSQLPVYTLPGTCPNHPIPHPSFFTSTYPYTPWVGALKMGHQRILLPVPCSAMGTLAPHLNKATLDTQKSISSAFHKEPPCQPLPPDSLPVTFCAQAFVLCATTLYLAT